MRSGGEARNDRAGAPNPDLAEVQARLYARDPARYDRLVSAGDPEGRLAAVLDEVAPMEGRRVLDVGAGTGRITRLLRHLGARTWSVDRELAMLRVARGHLGEDVGGTLSVADLRALPLPRRSVEAVVAGWVLGHFPFWSRQSWPREIDRALAELERVLVPGGCLLILETLGVGVRTPEAPGPELAAYYRLLETRGFRRRTVPTDYVFESLSEARELVGSFFGRRVARRVEGLRVPETTGLWWRSVPVR